MGSTGQMSKSRNRCIRLNRVSPTVPSFDCASVGMTCRKNSARRTHG